MLSPSEKSDIRRHLGYGAVAVNRYNDAVGSLQQLQISGDLYPLEVRLRLLDATDEAKLTGACLALVSALGQDPIAGNSVSLTVSSPDLNAPETISYSVGSNMSRYQLAIQIFGLACNNANLAQAGFQFAGPFQGLDDKNLAPTIEIKAPNPFTVSSTFSGLTALSVIQQGIHLEPSAVVARRLGVDTVKYGYIPILNYLASAIAGVTRNADVAKAGTYSRGRELRERKDLLNFWRNELSSFLDVPRNGSGSGGFVL